MRKSIRIFFLQAMVYKIDRVKVLHWDHKKWAEIPVDPSVLPGFFAPAPRRIRFRPLPEAFPAGAGCAPGKGRKRKKTVRRGSLRKQPISGTSRSQGAEAEGLFRLVPAGHRSIRLRNGRILSRKKRIIRIPFAQPECGSHRKGRVPVTHKGSERPISKSGKANLSKKNPERKPTQLFIIYLLTK